MRLQRNVTKLIGKETLPIQQDLDKSIPEKEKENNGYFVIWL